MVDLFKLAHHTSVSSRQGESPRLALSARVCVHQLHIADIEGVLGVEGRLRTSVTMLVFSLLHLFGRLGGWRGMWASLTLVFPHEPNAVFQGQLVQVNLSWLPFEDKGVWHV